MTERVFYEYNSLTNHYHEKFINMILQTGNDDGEWVAREKIHGANFSMWYNGIDPVYFGKRTSDLPDGFNFFSSYKLLDYKKNVELTYSNLIEAGMLDLGDTVAIFGEIFGGNFFGESEVGSSNVQGGMDYHPGTEFAAYDIMIYGDTEESAYILSDTEMVEMIDDGIKLCPEIGRGDLYSVLKLDNDFCSKVPELFGLTIPEGKRPQSEGYVVRPADGEKFLRNGTRIIIKSKNDKYSEKGGKTKTPKEEVVLTDEETELFKSVSVYLNTSRLEAVVSKIGEVSFKDFGMLTGLLMKDMMSDYDKDNECTLKSTTMWYKCSKQVGKLAADIIREYLKGKL